MLNKELIFLFLIQFYTTLGSFDLYVGREDAKAILGVSSQLWYVKGGNVNENALGYGILIPSNINILTFYWQNHINSTMPYTLKIDIGKKHAVHKPKLKNIKYRGLVPNDLTAWAITLNCTGKLITQTQVNITLQIPLTPSLQNITTVVIQRKKICTEKHPDGILVELIKKKNSMNIVYIMLIFLCSFLICIILLSAFNQFRIKKLRIRRLRRNCNIVESTCVNTPPSPFTAVANNQRSRCSPLLLTGKDSSIEDPHPHSAATTTTTLNTPDLQYLDPREGDIGIKLNALKGTADSLTIKELEMEGTFGRIHKGFFQLKDTDMPYSVLIKTVSECASEIQRGVLIAEGVMLASLKHHRILPVVAAITTPEKPPFIVFKSCNQTNLKKFLQSCHTLLTKEVVSLGTQVLEALAFLHSKQLLHKDIACRNCLVDNALDLQITDCALSRDMFPTDYHCLGDNENRPVKWLAIESLLHKNFSPASDVWSWGVLLWEVMTLGQQPYVEIDPFEMVVVLRQGVRLAQPINCPDEMFKAMTFCWTSQPRERPTINELLLYLNNFMQHLDRYV